MQKGVPETFAFKCTCYIHSFVGNPQESIDCYTLLSPEEVLANIHSGNPQVGGEERDNAENP